MRSPGSRGRCATPSRSVKAKSAGASDALDASAAARPKATQMKCAIVRFTGDRRTSYPSRATSASRKATEEVVSERPVAALEQIEPLFTGNVLRLVLRTQPRSGALSQKHP